MYDATIDMESDRAEVPEETAKPVNTAAPYTASARPPAAYRRHLDPTRPPRAPLQPTPCGQLNPDVFDGPAAPGESTGASRSTGLCDPPTKGMQR